MLLPLIEQGSGAADPDTVMLLGAPFVLDSLRAMSPDQFFVEVMSVTFGVGPQLGETFQRMDNTVLGAVAEGDTLVHVVTRTKLTFGVREMQEMNIVSAKKADSDWKLMLSNKVEGVAMMLEQSLMSRR